MAIDEQPMRLKTPPCIVINSQGKVVLYGGELDSPCTCREFAIAALAWAQELLATALRAKLTAPGGGDTSVEPMFALYEDLDSSCFARGPGVDCFYPLRADGTLEPKCDACGRARDLADAED